MSTYRLVILALTAALMASLIAIAVLAGIGINAPQTLDLIAAGSLGGLTGLLARPTSDPTDPESH